MDGHPFVFSILGRRLAHPGARATGAQPRVLLRQAAPRELPARTGARGAIALRQHRHRRRGGGGGVFRRGGGGRRGGARGGVWRLAVRRANALARELEEARAVLDSAEVGVQLREARPGMLNTRGVSSFNDWNTNNTRILVRKACILLYVIHGPPVFSILGRDACSCERIPPGQRSSSSCSAPAEFMSRPTPSVYLRQRKHALILMQVLRALDLLQTFFMMTFGDPGCGNRLEAIGHTYSGHSHTSVQQASPP